MNKKNLNKKIWSILFLLSMLYLPLTASNNAGDFLETGVSARALAMGNAFTSMSGGSSSIYFNPAAAAAKVINNEYSFSAANNFDDVDRKNLGFLTRFSNLGFSDKKSVAGLVYNSSFVGGIQKTQWGDDDRPVELGTFNSEKHNLTMTYSREQTPFLFYGFNLREYRYALDKYTARATALDLGIMYRLKNNFLNSPVVLGLAVHNIGRTPVSWSTGHVDTMPLRVNLGSAFYYTVFEKKLALSAELEKDENNPAYFKLGSEYWLVNNVFALRAGVERDKLSYGAGLNLLGLELDYAQADYEDLGLIKRVSLTYRF